MSCSSCRCDPRVATPRTHHPDSKKTVEVLVTQHLDCAVDVRVVMQSWVPTRCFRRYADVHRRVKKASEPCNGLALETRCQGTPHFSQSCPGLKVRLSFRVAAGIMFQLPCGRNVGPLSKNSCRARLYLLVAVARLAGRWCFWRLLVFSRWLVGFWLFRFPFRGRRPEDGSEGVGIKEGVPASQSVLLLGPVHLLRWGCHSMSSCDGVSPIIV